MPKRIQRERTRGWRMPENAVFVGRPSTWGSPFRVGDEYDAPVVRHLQSYDEANNHNGIVSLTREMAVEMFRMLGEEWSDPALAELRGKDLVCWCKLVDENGNPVPCHADVLLEWANG